MFKQVTKETLISTSEFESRFTYMHMSGVYLLYPALKPSGLSVHGAGKTGSISEGKSPGQPLGVSS